ncbi:MAG TPA: ATP-grasp domain-containing protein [Steroidobacteraceae bacterium]|nr:ATP-grasp domain-containing protein [Steroidobacteraceae bacterium]
MVSAAGSPASVSILRHLKALGHEVVGINARVETEKLGRAFCDRFFLCPLASASAYLDFLVERLADVDAFLPFIDEELIAIADGWSRIPKILTGRVALSDPVVIRDCVDKCRFQRACVEAGLPIAPTAKSPPAYFKPRFGRGGRGVLEVLDGRMFEALEGWDGVIQRAIRGEEFTVDAIFDRDGQLLATASRKRLLAAGVSTIGEVGFDPALHRLAERIGSNWHFKYAINFQCIRDGAGKDWIIELNPRLAGSAIFSTLADCDPFSATIALLSGGSWKGHPKRLRVWRYWKEMSEELSP